LYHAGREATTTRAGRRIQFVNPSAAPKAIRYGTNTTKPHDPAMNVSGRNFSVLLTVAKVTQFAADNTPSVRESTGHAAGGVNLGVPCRTKRICRVELSPQSSLLALTPPFHALILDDGPITSEELL
jgi:hypothetical protein